MSQNKVKKPLPLLDPNKLTECPICLDVIVPPISHCEEGHSMCRICFEGSGQALCPTCRRPMTNRRHVAFEQLLESVRGSLETSCRYAHKGCRVDLTLINKHEHELECRHRIFRCEGKIFANWKCDWFGEYEHLENHFKTDHPGHSSMQYKTEATTKIDFKSNFKDIQLISFFNGQSYFYYKHFVDVQKEKLYWVFQYVGLKKNAEHFSYEFEIHNGPVRKFKVSEPCHNDTIRIEDVFELENCVVMSFASARNYLNEEGELPFRFRIIKLKQNPPKA